jgi:Fe-Mn family superoxide dismutase
MKRKTFLSALIGTSLALKFSNGFSRESLIIEEGPFSLPALGYEYGALEPGIDRMTMEIHHTKHHQAYVNNLNKAVVGTDLEKKSLEELIKGISKLSAAIRNNGGGHWNHSFFWKSLSPKSSQVFGNLQNAIIKEFGSIDKMTEAFNSAALSRFGSGWAWLIVQNGKLKICSTPNQDNPLMDDAKDAGTPIIGLDVWEHAYYLKYQNKRADYIKAYWSLVDWNTAEANYNAAIKK